MAIPSVPDQVDSDPINVQEKHIKQVDCPNTDCEGVLDITNVNIGTKIKCKDCGNITWLPDYTKKWWEKPGSILAGLLLSFIVGVLSSLTASWLLGPDEAEQSAALPAQEQQSQPPLTRP